MLQLILVALMIAFPEMVTYWLDKPVQLAPSALERQFQGVPSMDDLNLPSFDPPK